MTPASPLADGPRGGRPRRQRRRPWSNRAVVALSRRARARRGRAAASRSSPRSRTSPPSRRAASASRCASTAPRSRAASSTCPRTAARASASCHTARRRGSAHEAEVGDRPRRLPARRPRACARVEVVARPARPGGRRRSAHGAHRGRDVLPRGGAARGRRGFSITTALPDELDDPRPRRLRAPSSWRTSPSRRRRPAAGAHALRRGRRRPLHLGGRSRRRRRLEPDDEGRAAAAAGAQAHAPRRCPAARPRARPSTSAPPSAWRRIDRRHPLLAGFPAQGDGLASARFFQFMLLAPRARRARPLGRAALRERRARAGRRRGGPRARPAAHDDGRSRVDRPADPPRLPAADAGGGALPRGRAVGRRDRRAHRRPASARSPLGADDRAHRGRQAERRVALADARRRGHAGDAAEGRGAQRDCSPRPTSRASTACAPRAPTAPSSSARTRALRRQRSTPRESDPDAPAPTTSAPTAPAGAARGGPRRKRRLELWHALGAAVDRARAARVAVDPATPTRQGQGMNKPFGNDDSRLAAYVAKTYAPEDDGAARDPRALRARRACPTSRSPRSTPATSRCWPRAAGARRPSRSARWAATPASRSCAAWASAASLDTIEIEPRHAEVARESFRRAGVARRRRASTWAPALRGAADAGGAAARSISCFIDADKEGYPDYLDWAADNLRPGGIVLLDNAFLFGDLADKPDGRARRRRSRAMQAFHQILAQQRPLPRHRPAHGRGPGLRRPDLRFIHLTGVWLAAARTPPVPLAPRGRAALRSPPPVGRATTGGYRLKCTAVVRPKLLALRCSVPTTWSVIAKKSKRSQARTSFERL